MNTPPADPLFMRHVCFEANGCWTWTASTCTPRHEKRAYGHLGRRINGKLYTILAHRYAYEMAKGPIPDGLTIDHLCRNTLCVNPEHLEAVPIKVNCQRGKGSITVCKESLAT